jgi:hypothetical protein
MFKGFLRTVASTLLAVAILVTVVRPVPLAASSHKSDLEPAAVQELVTRALEARWNMLVNPKTPLEHFYHPDTQSLAAQERERVERHYLQPAHRAGFRYTDVELGAKFESIEVKGNTALVKAVVDVSYTSEYPGDPLPIMSKVAGLEHVISLIHQDGQWHIADDQYFDTFSKRGQKGPGVPSVSADGIPDTRLKDETAQDVIPLWYHYYNRAGAVAYADAWWDRRNPEYRYFAGADCANYVSQCFDHVDGGQALMAWKSPFIWWYDFNGTPENVWDDTWSTSWTVPHDQAYNLSRNADVDEMRGSYVDSAAQLALGDSIYYDFGEILSNVVDGHLRRRSFRVSRPAAARMRQE